MPIEEIEELKTKEAKKPVAAEAIDPVSESPAGALPPSGEPLPATEGASGPPAAEAAEIEQLRTERDQLLDRLARAQAEFENARRRAEREKADFRDHVAGSVIEQFLPVLDNFELALKSTGSEEQLRAGVGLIVKQMVEILEKMQVRAIPAAGEAFDPRVHEALGTVDRDDLPDQHVAEEIRRGYKIRERLLRPALVRVAQNSRQVSE